jgi:hypothetical protein
MAAKDGVLTIRPAAYRSGPRRARERGQGAGTTRPAAMPTDCDVTGARSESAVALAPRGDGSWRGRLRRGRNLVSLVMLATVFARRSGVSWRRWRRRHPGH